jgi:hypothetical protein
VSQLAGRLSYRVQELNVKVESKTLDNVFITALVSVQYQVLRENVYEAFYALTNPQQQITAHVYDVMYVREEKERKKDRKKENKKKEKETTQYEDQLSTLSLSLSHTYAHIPSFLPLFAGAHNFLDWNSTPSLKPRRSWHWPSRMH